MAYDRALISKVRATYECNSLSFVEVHEMFSEIASHKTIEGWAKKDRDKGKPWEKNRYKNLEEAIEEVVTDSMEKLESEATIALKEKLTGTTVPVELMEDDVYLAALGTEKVKQVLTKKSYLEMMDENLLQAHTIAMNSGHINTKATFQMMVKSVVETKYGKNINLNTSTELTVIDKEELSGKSQSELLEMLNEVEDNNN